MKRIAVVAALAVLVALAVAGPAAASAPAPGDGAYVYPMDGGSWGLVVGGQPSATWNDAGTPIPAGTDVWLSWGWVGYTKGLILNVPATLLYKASLAGDPVIPTYAAGKQYWSAMYTEAGLPAAFNPKIGAKAYGRDYFVEVGSLAAGTYDGVCFQKVAHTTTDLMTGYYDGQHKPFMTRAGVTEFPFSITIQ